MLSTVRIAADVPKKLMLAATMRMLLMLLVLLMLLIVLLMMMMMMKMMLMMMTMMMVVMSLKVVLEVPAICNVLALRRAVKTVSSAHNSSYTRIWSPDR